MNNKELKTVYRIYFAAQNSVYEIYAKQIDQGDMFGFIEVEELLFGEATSIVVDPAEEKLKLEFQGVKKTFIPLHAILRIDVVEKEGSGKIVETTHAGNNVTPFPTHLYTSKK